MGDPHRLGALLGQARVIDDEARIFAPEHLVDLATEHLFDRRGVPVRGCHEVVELLSMVWGDPCADGLNALSLSGKQ
jgi:hypothetical protein